MALENLIVAIFAGLGVAGLLWRLRRRERAKAARREAGEPDGVGENGVGGGESDS